MFKDVKLWPGGARDWDWDETATGHRAGVQPDDVRELLDHGAGHVVIAADARVDWPSTAAPSTSSTTGALPTRCSTRPMRSGVTRRCAAAARPSAP